MKMMTIKCPHCSEKIELPDDPRIGELKDTIEKQGKLIERLVEKLEKAQEPPPEPKKKKIKQKVVHKGPIYDIEDEDEIEVDDDVEVDDDDK